MQVQGGAGGAGARQSGEQASRARTSGLGSGFGSQAAGLAACGPLRSTCSQVAPELRNLGRCGEQRGVYFTQRSPGDGSRMGGRPSSPLDKQQQQHLKGE